MCAGQAAYSAIGMRIYNASQKEDGLPGRYTDFQINQFILKQAKHLYGKDKEWGLMPYESRNELFVSALDYVINTEPEE